MKLSISDRFNFGSLYPQKSSLTDQILTKDIAEKVELSQEDNEAIQLKSEGQSIMWNKEKAEKIELDVEFSKTEMNFLKDRVKDLDSKKEVTAQNADLCLKIKEIK